MVSFLAAVDLVVKETSDSVLSSPPHFSSSLEIPLSMLLPDFFFALGPWRRPEEHFRAAPLQVDMFLLIDSIDGGDSAFWGERTMPMVRFFFQTLHDQAWDERSVANSLYD